MFQHGDSGPPPRTETTINVTYLALDLIVIGILRTRATAHPAHPRKSLTSAKRHVDFENAKLQG